MIVVIPCCEADQDQAHRLLLWIGELGRVSAHAVLFCSNDCDTSSLMQAGQLAFNSIQHNVDAENIKCNWQTNDPGSRDPSGPNSIFRQVAWTMYMRKVKQPWLFLEPDSIPLTRDWYYVLHDEYKTCGRPVMGDMVSTNSPHLSGVAVYPYNVPELFPKMVHNVQGAFDTSAAKEVLAVAHITPRIMDRWRSPEFTSDTFSKIRPEAVLFHADKSGSLIPLLRQKLGIQAPYTKEQLETKGPEFETNRRFAAMGEVMDTVLSDPVVEAFKHESERFMSDPVLRNLGHKQLAPDIHAMHREFIVDREVKKIIKETEAPVVDIYLKTYPKDYELANYCLKSIAKFVTGYRRVIMECPSGGTETMPFNDVPQLLWDNTFRVRSQDRQPGYIDQQAKKLSAFKHTDATHLLYIDSDCCFQRPFDVAEMFRDGKSTWQFTPLVGARDDQKSAWVPVMEKFIGKKPQHEFMRRHPHILPRWLPEEMYKFCRYRHGKSLDEYIMAQGDPANPLQLSFSEFNCAGFFAWEYFHDRIAWITDAEAAPAPVVQGFTHGGPELIKEHIDQVRKILGEDNPVFKTENSIQAPENINEVEEFQVIWNRSSEINITKALEKLAAEAAKSPLHKARLWKRITAALGMEKPEKAAKRRRKGAKKITNPSDLQAITDSAVAAYMGVKKQLRGKAEEQAIMDAPLK